MKSTAFLFGCSLLLLLVVATQLPQTHASEFMEDPLDDSEDLFADDDTDSDEQGGGETLEFGNEPDVKENIATEEEELDTDEFTGFEAHKPQTPKKQPKSNLANTATKEAPRTYHFEMAAIAFVVLYIVMYFVGSSQNDKIAQAWFKSAESLFQAQFAELGAYNGEDGLMLKDAPNSYKFFASGRRNCFGLLATLELVSRQDLFSYILKPFGMSQPEDILSIDIPMSADEMDTFVFAIVRKRDVNKARRNYTDLENFGVPTASHTLPKQFAILTDVADLESKFVNQRLIKVLKDCGDLVHMIHFTDQNPTSFQATKSVLKFKFSVPAEADLPRLRKLLELAIMYADIVANVRLSAQNKAKAQKKRAALEAMLNRAKHEERQELAQRRKEEKKKKAEENQPTLSKEKQRKKEEREYKQSLKKRGPKVKVLR